MPWGEDGRWGIAFGSRFVVQTGGCAACTQPDENDTAYSIQHSIVQHLIVCYAEENTAALRTVLL